MDNHTQFAVTDGPGGLRWVKAPSDRLIARELKARQGGRFWCAERAGGCGGRLALHAGDIRAVYFAHHPGEGADCRFRWDLEAEERSYLHLALQLALQSWLGEQGIESTLEATLENGGRADLLVKTVEPSDVTQTIEVQLSPIGTEHWSARTALYLRSAQAVSWIFGLQVPRPVLHEVRRRHGYALRVRLAEDAATGMDDLYGPESIEVGTETARDSIEWATLTECHLGENGIITPFTQAAIDKHLAQPDAPPVTPIPARSPRPSSGPAQPRAWAPPKPATVDEPSDPVGRTRPVQRAASPMVRPRGWGRAPLTSFVSFGIDPAAARADWPDLPEELRYPAAVMAYIVTRIDAGGPAWSLSFPDLDDGMRIQQALVDAGLAELYEGTRSVIRWQRPGAGMPR